jgi:hypothetical protein
MTWHKETKKININEYDSIKGKDTYLSLLPYLNINNTLIKDEYNGGQKTKLTNTIKIFFQEKKSLLEKPPQTPLSQIKDEYNDDQKTRLKNTLNTFLEEKNPLSEEPPQTPPSQEVDASFRASVLSYSVLQTASARIEALRQYSVVMHSDNNGPAILYKVKDIFDMPPSWGTASFTLDRIYKPCGHTWNNNSVWMLAHIHKQSEFMVMSAVTTSNLMRSNEPGRYSAFARELATAMLAGYQVTSITYEHHHQITHLSSTKTREEALAVTIMDCLGDAESCQKGIMLYQCSVAMYQTSPKLPSNPTPEPSKPKNSEPFLENYRISKEFAIKFLNSVRFEDRCLRKRNFLDFFNHIRNDRKTIEASEADTYLKKLLI